MGEGADRARDRRPGEIAYGSSGNGMIVHPAGEMLSAITKVKLVHVREDDSTRVLRSACTGHLTDPTEEEPSETRVIDSSAARGRRYGLHVRWHERADLSRQ